MALWMKRLVAKFDFLSSCDSAEVCWSIGVEKERVDASLQTLHQWASYCYQDDEENATLTLESLQP
jgi:hypothetical protein